MILFCTDETLAEVRSFMDTIASRLCGSAHHGKAITTFESDDDRRVLLLRLPIWKAVNSNVRTKRPMEPGKVFLNDLKVYYSKTKEVV